MLTREQLLKRPLTLEAVPAPELGDGQTLNVKLLSAGEFMKLSADSKAGTPETGYAFWLIATVVDETGTPILKPDDLDAVTNLPFPLVQRLLEAAQRINGTADNAAGN